MNRRILALLLALVMVAGLMTGCASGKQEAAAPRPRSPKGPAVEETAAEPEQTEESPAEEEAPAEPRRCLSPTASAEPSSSRQISPASRPAAPSQR